MMRGRQGSKERDKNQSSVSRISKGSPLEKKGHLKSKSVVAGSQDQRKALDGPLPTGLEINNNTFEGTRNFSMKGSVVDGGNDTYDQILNAETFTNNDFGLGF